MAGVLLSGPAGAGKSALARHLLAEHGGLAVLADIQAIVVMLMQLQRREDGTYPVRDERVLPLAEYLRRSIITQAVERDVYVVATNSDGNRARRDFLLAQLGTGAVERIVDPGIEVVRARLADTLTGVLSDDCQGAINRWYGRL